jgi:hypothetical protein
VLVNRAVLEKERKSSVDTRKPPTRIERIDGLVVSHEKFSDLSETIPGGDGIELRDMLVLQLQWGTTKPFAHNWTASTPLKPIKVDCLAGQGIVGGEPTEEVFRFFVL